MHAPHDPIDSNIGQTSRDMTRACGKTHSAYTCGKNMARLWVMTHGQKPLSFQGIQFTSTHTPTDTRFVCPECGGTMATQTGLILVQICWACRGEGTLTATELDWYETEANRRVAAGE